MGVYGDWAEKYFESGLYTVPCGVNKDKAPPFFNWTDYCETPPSETVFSGWVTKYKDAHQIGLLLGKSTGKVAFDFDYAYDPKKCKLSEEEFKKDRMRIEKEIMEILPESPCGKVGAKGWTRIYKWNPSLTNKQLDRNGVRLFDFLSQGKQTIIPPSIHSTKEDGKKIIYQWIDNPLDECSDLPEISMAIIESIVEIYSQSRGGRPSLEQLSRHARVMYYIYDILKVDNDLERVANFAIEYDKKMNSGRFSPKDVPYLSDKNHHKSTDAIINAKTFVEKINKWAIKNDLLKTKDEKKEKQIVTVNTWNHFFETSFKECRKDIFSEETFIRLNEKQMWAPIKNHEDVLKSYARTKKLPKTHVPEELGRWTLENQDTKFLCDIPPWDGVDYISMIAGKIESDKFTSDQIVEIHKHWGVTCFRRLYNSGVQNRCVILKGGQGFGKDTVEKAMFGEFKPYYEPTTLAGTPKDVLEIASRLLMVHIEEFDQTKHIDVGFLKSLITQPSSFFRESYARSPNSKPMRASFISTANVDDIFRDPTGNRRFIVIPVTKITWDYPQDKSLQCLAQLKALYEQGKHFALSGDIEKTIKEIIDQMTPDPLENSVVELYETRFERMTAWNSESVFSGRPFLTGEECVEMLNKVAKDAGCGLRKVQSLLKLKGYSYHSKSGTKYFKDPSLAAAHKLEQIKIAQGVD